MSKLNIVNDYSEQLEILADYIMNEIPGEPSQSQGAGDTAVRILKQYRSAFEQIVEILHKPEPEIDLALEVAFSTLGGFIAE